MDKEDAVHIHNGILLSHENNGILPFAAMWMDLENTTRSEIKSDVCVCAKFLQSCLTLCDPIDGSPPGSSMGFSRQEYWSGVPSPSPYRAPKSLQILK